MSKLIYNLLQILQHLFGFLKETYQINRCLIHCLWHAILHAWRHVRKGKGNEQRRQKFKWQNSCQWVKLESDLLQAWPLCCQGRHQSISASGQSCLTSWLPSFRRTWHSPRETLLTWSPSTADSGGDTWLHLSVLSSCRCQAPGCGLHFQTSLFGGQPSSLCHSVRSASAAEDTVLKWVITLVY